MFNSLHALSVYNFILITTINLLIKSHILLHVFHILYNQNSTADALSHLGQTTTCHLQPNLINSTPSNYAGGFILMNKGSTVPRSHKHKAWTHECLLWEHLLALASAIEPSSSTSYSFALASCLHFCSIHSFPLKPTANTLSLFVVYMYHYIKPHSVSSYLQWLPKLPQCLYISQRFEYCCSMNKYFSGSPFIF